MSHKEVDPYVVYYIQRGDGLIKIGYSSSLQTRRRRIEKYFGKSALLAFEKGGESLEKARHIQFAEFREEGEWFRPEYPLLRHIEGINE